MKVRNAAPGRPERIMRGLASTLRSTGRGITLRDNGVDVEPVWDIIAGQGLKVTDLDDGLARLDAIGGTGPDGGQTGGGSIVEMLNNSGQDLLPGAVVVVDETADKAVTVTTTEGDTRIVGVVQEPIGIDDVGLVLFNGYAPVINDLTAVRGEYAKTSTTATQSTSTADRESGSFAVYLTGNDLPDFASSERTTTAAIPVASLDIDMPPVIPADRTLFLALWLTDAASSVSVPDWTLIGSEAGFNYYTKLSEGDDTATASWTGASVAVATVLLLSPNVHPGLPVQDFDYENTAAAAEVTGLSDAPRYAIAGVKGDVASPGDGYVRLGGGTAGFDTGSSLSIVQEAYGRASDGVSFVSPVTVGNLIVAVQNSRNGGPTGSGNLQMAPISGVPDTSWTDVAINAHTDTTGDCDYVSIQAKIATSTSAGPFYNTASPTSVASEIYLFEVAGVGVDGFEALQESGANGSTVDIGSFATVGADDLVIFSTVGRDVSGGYPDPTVAATGYTVDRYANNYAGSPVWWVGHRSGSGGAIDAEFTQSGSNLNWFWGVAAAHFVAGDQAVEGTLAGKYIGHDSTATSPFTADNDDAIFAINLQLDAQASALLYGPDLGGEGSGSEPTADDHIADTTDAHDASAISLADSGGFLTATDVEAAIAELAAKDIGYTAHGSMGSTETFSALTGWHSGTFNADCTFTFSGATSGIVASMVLELLEDGTGTWTPTWPGSVVWPGGTPPTHDETAGTTTLYLFQSRDGGTTWYGFQAGGGGTSSVDELDDLSDVTITTPAENDTLRYISGEWVNDNRYRHIVTNGFDSLVWEGDELVWEWST